MIIEPGEKFAKIQKQVIRGRCHGNRA